jgi:anti-anti-sigma factor
MATPLRLDTDRRADGVLVLSASGEIDLSNVDAFTDALSGAVNTSNDGAVLTVDFSEVEYLDSGAINTLFAYTDQIRLIANPVLMPVLTVSGLTDVVSIEPAGPSGAGPAS